MEYFDRIKQTRQNAGDNQNALVELWQTTQYQVSKYETGAQELPLRRLVAFCRHYNVSADWILGLSEKVEVD